MQTGYYPHWDRGFVKDYLDSLKVDGQRRKAEARLRYDLDVLEAFWPRIQNINITVKPLQGYEPLRELIREYHGIAYRIFFCVKTDRIWLLHAIEKKKDKTPKSDLTLARSRMNNILNSKMEGAHEDNKK